MSDQQTTRKLVPVVLCIECREELSFGQGILCPYCERPVCGKCYYDHTYACDGPEETCP